MTAPLFRTTEALGWVAFLKGGTRVVEGDITGDNQFDGMRKGVSSDFLPADQIHRIGYMPIAGRTAMQQGLFCDVDLDRGERFIRYWTTVMDITGTNIPKRLYAVGWYREVSGEKKYNIVYLYPKENKLVFSINRYSAPPYNPNTFSLFPNDLIVNQGPQEISWTYNGEHASLKTTPNGLIFSSK